MHSSTLPWLPLTPWLRLQGTKDKRGLTSQYVTAYKIAPERLAALNPRLRGVKVGNFEYADSELRLGMLSGNRFKVGCPGHLHHLGPGGAWLSQLPWAVLLLHG